MHPRPPLLLAGRPRPRTFLRYPHEHHARGRREAVSIVLDDIILPFAFPELDPGDLVRVTPGPQPRPERGRDLAKHRRRGNHPAPGLAQERHHPALTLQPRDVAVEVQPIHALDVQRHVVSDMLRHFGHGLLSSSASSERTIVWTTRGTNSDIS